MIRVVYMAIDRIDSVIGAIVSLFSASVGTVMYNSDTIMASVNQQDPEWFCNLAPILQTIAWVIAIAVGIFTLIKIGRELRAKNKQKKLQK